MRVRRPAISAGTFLCCSLSQGKCRHRDHSKSQSTVRQWLQSLLQRRGPSDRAACQRDHCQSERNHDRIVHTASKRSTGKSDHDRERHRSSLHAAARNVDSRSADDSRSEIAADHLHTAPRNRQRNHQTDAHTVGFRFPSSAGAGPFRWPISDREVAEPGKRGGVNHGNQSCSKGRCRSGRRDRSGLRSHGSRCSQQGRQNEIADRKSDRFASCLVSNQDAIRHGRSQ